MPAWLGVLTLCVGMGGMFLMPWARRFDARTAEIRKERNSRSPRVSKWAVAAVAILMIAAGIGLSLAG